LGDPYYSTGHYLLGVEGLALLRDGGRRRRFEDLQSRVEEIAAIVGGLDSPPYSDRRDRPPVDLDQGYTIWSRRFDTPGKLDHDPIQALEGPIVRSLVGDLPRGSRVLDLGCGTGRHTGAIREAGHSVVGADLNEAMLGLAREKLPDVEFRQAELTNLPFPDESFDGVVCGLTFSHVPVLGPAIAEIARVLVPGGRAIISAPHPFVVNILAWHPPVFDADGNGWELPQYEHWHGDYIHAFTAAGLSTRECFEPVLTEELLRDPVRQTPLQAALEAAIADRPAVFVWLAEKT
jgi:SAM-dependent methyltransferase